MKTTLNVRDDLYRRAKAEAALQGKSVGRFLEDAIEMALALHADDGQSWAEWAAALPKLSKRAISDLDRACKSPDFREIDPEMWV